VPSSALTSLARASGQLGSIIGVSTGPAADAQRLLDRAGYKRTTSDFFVRYRLDEETGEFELRDVQLAVSDLGEVLVNLKLGNVPKSGIRDGAELLSAGTTTTLVHASVSFKDRSLVSRLLKAYAAERNISEADALTRVLRDLKADRDRARDAVEREALDALVRFIERPSEIRMALEPSRPVPLLAMGLQFLGGRSFAKDAFGLKFSAR
jgi:RNA polymerase-interacting CarD/CdnL/TRCF family regulator